MVEIVASRRRGRPSKGPRAVVKALVPPELKEAAASTAKARGMTANDYIAALIAADTGLTVNGHSFPPTGGHETCP
jgi:hypothetical protein